jgi:type II secretion system protein N
MSQNSTWDNFKFYFKKFRTGVFFTVLFFVVFLFVLFPYDDLSDLVTEQVAKATQNQVYLQFDKLGIAALPPSIAMENVSLDSPFAPTLKIGELFLAPSVAGFLAFKPGFTARVKSILGGDVNFTMKTGKKINDQANFSSLDLELDQVDLKNVSQFANLPLQLEGKLGGDIQGDVDPQFIEQPDVTADIVVGKFNIPAGTVAIPNLGPISIPRIGMKSVTLKGHLVGGEFLIEDGQFGAQGDLITGKVKGKVAVQFRQEGNQVRPIFGQYSLKLDLSLDKGMDKSLGGFYGFLDKYKTVTGNGVRYALTLSAGDFNAAPSFSSL